MRSILSVTSLLFTAVVIMLLVLTRSAYSFCIYNRMDDNTEYYVRQISGHGGTAFRRFRRDRLHPGEGACCPQTEKTCNKEGNSDSIVSLWVSSIKDQYSDLTGYKISCPAGGYIQLKGLFEKPSFHVFDKDHNPFNADIRHERGNMLYINKKKTQNLASHEKHENVATNENRNAEQQGKNNRQKNNNTKD